MDGGAEGYAAGNESRRVTGVEGRVRERVVAWSWPFSWDREEVSVATVRVEVP